MAAGDRQIQIKATILEQGDHVQVNYRTRVEATAPNDEDWQAGVMSVSWTDFMAALTNGEKAALASIKDKMIAAIKQRVVRLAQATEA